MLVSLWQRLYVVTHRWWEQSMFRIGYGVVGGLLIAHGVVEVAAWFRVGSSIDTLGILGLGFIGLSFAWVGFAAWAGERSV